MTNIYEAYKKQVVGLHEMAERLQRVGNVRLYPAPAGAQQEEFSKLALRLLGMKSDLRGSVIGVASSASGEGASFVSYSLASFLGLVYEQRVAWIDGNAHSPQEQLRDEAGPSFVDLLQNPSSVTELPCGASQVTLIPGGTTLRKELASFAGRKSTDLIAALAKRYDFTILDLPPILESQNAAFMAQKTDGLLLVVAHRHLKYEPIGSGIRSLNELGVNVLGAVMNRREYDLPGFLHRRI